MTKVHFTLREIELAEKLKKEYFFEIDK